MVHEYRKLSQTFKEINAENNVLKNSSVEPSIAQLGETDSLQTELSKMKIDNDSLIIKSCELSSENERLNHVMSSWTKSSVYLRKLHETQKPLDDKSGLGFSFGEISSEETSTQSNLANDQFKKMNFVKSSVTHDVCESVKYNDQFTGQLNHKGKNGIGYVKPENCKPSWLTNRLENDKAKVVPKSSILNQQRRGSTNTGRQCDVVLDFKDRWSVLVSDLIFQIWVAMRRRFDDVLVDAMRCRLAFQMCTCVTLNGSGIQLAVGPQPLRLRNHNFGLAHRIMVKRLATSHHDPLGITDSSCKNQLVVVSVQYGPFNPYIPIRSTTIGKSRVVRDPIAIHTSWRSNSDIVSVTRVSMTFRVVRTNQYNQDLGLIHSTNGNHLESPNEGSSIHHQVTIYLHAQNITMFPTNETWYFASQILVSSSGDLILILTVQSTRN
ncbi:hypothetical protein F511_39283 [Dorcoceras hygrometricum]|uniref:Uncharacterized protein n=1 Tax=Dorcoceras hygrometricum TaxID=472368 RepID=A0A2Z7CZN1_9LAMI|nr:hypothetical protein F511_39283 [Dorcoceras hygrometricum]